MRNVKSIGLLLGPILFLVLHLFGDSLLHSALGVASWMVVWWVTEAVSLFVTALLPIVLFPLVGVFDVSKVASFYGHKIIFLFMGGFIIALGMEKWNLHKRIALRIIGYCGNSASSIVLGFMVATALISMWISNTATTVMMLPMAMSVNEIVVKANEGNKSLKRFSMALFLGLAYAANIGGVATIIGTPPNVVMASMLEAQLNIELSFAKFMVIGFPVSIVMLVVAYIVLTKNLRGKIEFVDIQPIIREKKKELGAVSKQEKMVLVIFIITAALWILRVPINNLIGEKLLNDYVVAMAGGIAVLTIPSSLSTNERLLEWSDMKRLPWGILILFGGGLALAGALDQTGVIQEISDWVVGLGIKELSFYLLLLVAIGLFMTEVMSNVALTTVFLPVVIGIALGLGQDAIYFVIPTTLAASFAFMLPISTPPNAVVFSSGEITVGQMVRKGVVLNVIGVLLLWLVGVFLLPLVY